MNVLNQWLLCVTELKPIPCMVRELHLYLYGHVACYHKSTNLTRLFLWDSILNGGSKVVVNKVNMTCTSWWFLPLDTLGACVETYTWILKELGSLQEARWPTHISPLKKIIEQLSSPFINLFNFHLELTIVFGSFTYLLSLFHSSTSLYVNHFLSVSFVNLNWSNVYPLLHVLKFVCKIKTSLVGLKIFLI